MLDEADRRRREEREAEDPAVAHVREAWAAGHGTPPPRQVYERLPILPLN